MHAHVCVSSTVSYLQVRLVSRVHPDVQASLAEMVPMVRRESREHRALLDQLDL